MPNKEEVRRIVEGFAQSGMTRRQYCEKHNIGMSTLDYWRRRIQETKPRLVEVAVEAQPSAGFVLVLANGRRIESSWRFGEADLLRLIGVAEG
jgi:transposase-like protein